MRKLAAVLVVMCTTIPARAEILPTYSLRELTYRADTIVLATPIEDAAKGQFKVTQVLRGRAAAVGATINLAPDDCAVFSLNKRVNPEEPKSDDAHAPITEALLFLSGPPDGDKLVHVVLSGLMFGTATGEVLTAQQRKNPGPYYMTLCEDRHWPILLREAKATAAAMDEVFQLRAATGKERAPGLLKWIERHRLEFGGGFFDGERTGWGTLETDVFDWICEKGQPVECWSAVRLYAELNHGAALPMKRPCFGTRAAREFLFLLALNERILDGERARAMTLLTHHHTLVPRADTDNPAVTPCSDADLVVIVQKFTLLLASKSGVVRSGATGALRMIQSLRGDAEPVQMELKNALPALEKAYTSEKTGPSRDLLVEMIHGIGGADHWNEVSGSKTGMAILLKDFGHSNDQVHFWLQVLPGKEKIYERPTLVFERLDPNNKRVLETKTLALAATNGPKWEDGWAGGDLLLVQFSRQGLPPGDWRVSVRGTAGKDKVPWASEAKQFLGTKPVNAEERYYKEGLRER